MNAELSFKDVFTPFICFLWSSIQSAALCDTLLPPVTREKPTFRFCPLNDPRRDHFSWILISDSLHICRVFSAQAAFSSTPTSFHLRWSLNTKSLSLCINLFLLPGSPPAYCGRRGHHHCSLPARSPIVSQTASRWALAGCDTIQAGNKFHRLFSKWQSKPHLWLLFLHFSVDGHLFQR